MDDLSDLLGIKQNPDEAFALKELARRANDSLRVANPTATDYHVAWDLSGAGGYFIVPARDKDIGFGKGQNVHPRYIAFKFFKEITALILEAEQRLLIEEENKRRESKGLAAMDKTFANTEELKFVYAQKANMDNADKLMELLPKIILGVEREWGMDQLPYQPRRDTLRMADILAIVDRKVGEPVSEAKPQEAPKTTKLPDEEVDPVAAVV